MTLPYVWYRTSVWLPLLMAVNNFWGFLVIFWKVPVIMELAACCAELKPRLGRPRSSFPSPHEGEFIVNRFSFFMVDYICVMAARMLMIFSVHLIPFLYSFLFVPPFCHSTVTGTYLWDICRKVGISMWKGSCRQCFALCIHSICMKCSRCHSC